jgi:hypothetical protein
VGVELGLSPYRKNTLRMFENKMLRRMTGSRRKEVTGS